jgi:histidine ammonia-lyase
MVRGSAINESHADCGRVQDPYSLRCTATVLGAALDAFVHARQVLERELRSVTDNPVCFPETGEVISGGNFHGQPLALILDYMAITLAGVASMSERRAYLLLDGVKSGLADFLAVRPGIESGLMMAQYTAASLVSENKVLSHPASVDSIPTSAGQEDHVSMGMTAALKLGRVVENTRRVVAVELLCAVEGIERRRPLTSGSGVEEAVRRVRRRVQALEGDRPLALDIEALTDGIARGEFDLDEILNAGRMKS